MKQGAVLHSISDDLERFPARQSLEATALVWFSNSKDPHTVIVRNISAGGMMAICDVPVVIGDNIKAKIAFAQQFAAQNIISSEDLAYTTETDLLDQEINQSAKIDVQWQQRLEQSSPPKHPKDSGQ